MYAKELRQLSWIEVMEILSKIVTNGEDVRELLRHFRYTFWAL